MTDNINSAGNIIILVPHHLVKMRGKSQLPFHGLALAIITITKATSRNNSSGKKIVTDLSRRDPAGTERKADGAASETTLVVLHEQLGGGTLHGGGIRRNKLVVLPSTRMIMLVFLMSH
jgi:hypothetical protein